MLYEKKKQLTQKYAEVLDAIGKENPQGEDQHTADMDVALIMLEAMAKTGQHNLYKGVPDDFDWEVFMGDMEASK